MRKRLFGWAAVACALSMMVGCADPDVGERQVNVIPAPVELVRGEGLFPIGPRTEIVITTRRCEVRRLGFRKRSSESVA